MGEPLRILMVEDSEDDAALVRLELERGGFMAQWHRVETAESLRSALDSFKPAIIICDYALPQFSAPQALQLVHEHGLDVPFIVVSGTVGEDSAVEMMKAGAHDYVMKTHLARLSVAVRRELHEAFIRGERNRAEVALAQAESHLEKAQEVAHLGSWVYALSSQAPMIWSKEMYRILGLAPSEFDGNPETFFSFIHPDDRSAVSEARQLAIRGEAPYALDHRIVLRNGTIRWVHEEAVVERERIGKPVRMVGAMMDITHRKQAEEELRRSEVRFTRLAESGVIGILVGDILGNIKDANDAILKMLGYARNELLGAKIRWVDLTPAEWRHLDDVAFEDLKATGSARLWEKEYRKKDGGRVPVLMGMAMLDSAQHISFVLDITERKRLEEERKKSFQLEEQTRQAQEASQFKSKFLANMSHELRTPLNAVIGFSELLEQEMFGPLQPRQREYVQNILSSGQHLLTLVNEVLDISKVEAGRMELARDWVSLAQVVHSVERILQSLAAKKDVRLELALPKFLPDVFIDSVRMKQVLYNLLANGIKFTPAGGVVRLGVRTEGGQLELSVEDTGIGIAPDQLPRLFKPFEQIQDGVGGEREGTGLGLALTKSLVELHGGSISVRSEVGKGTSFLVTLPVLRASPAVELSERTNGGDLILVVENDPKTAESLAGHIRALGFAVAVASNSDSGLQLASELRPVAIILDLQMSRIDDGWPMLARVKNSPATASIPVIVFSVMPEPNRALYLGAMDYLVKPTSREKLAQCLERIGVATHDVSGVRVLIIGDASPELTSIATHLGEAGCDVRMASGVHPEDLAQRPIDVAIANGVQAVRAEVRAAVPASIPVLLIVDERPTEESGSLNRLVRIARSDVLRPERLVQIVRAAVNTGGNSALHSPSGLPSGLKLVAHLRNTISRAEREFKNLAIIATRVPLSHAQVGIDWAEAVKSRLRPEDFMGVASDDVLMLIAYGADEGAADRLTRRFEDLLWTFGKLKTARSRVLWYPVDGRTAEELLERCTKTDTTEIRQ